MPCIWPIYVRQTRCDPKLITNLCPATRFFGVVVDSVIALHGNTHWHRWQCWLVNFHQLSCVGRVCWRYNFFVSMARWYTMNPCCCNPVANLLRIRLATTKITTEEDAQSVTAANNKSNGRQQNTFQFQMCFYSIGGVPIWPHLILWMCAPGDY